MKKITLLFIVICLVLSISCTKEFTMPGIWKLKYKTMQGFGPMDIHINS